MQNTRLEQTNEVEEKLAVSLAAGQSVVLGVFGASHTHTKVVTIMNDSFLVLR